MGSACEVELASRNVLYMTWSSKALYMVPGPKWSGVQLEQKPSIQPNIAFNVCILISCVPCRMATTGTAFLLGKLERFAGKENENKSSPFIVRPIYDARLSNIDVTYACEIDVSSSLALTRCGCEWTSNTASRIHARARILLPSAKLAVDSGDIIGQAACWGARDAIGCCYFNNAISACLVGGQCRPNFPKCLTMAFGSEGCWLRCSEFKLKRFNFPKTFCMQQSPCSL